MTYQNFEDSVELGAPVELYEFIQGTERNYYVSADISDLVIDGQPYTPYPVRRNRVKQTDNVFKDGLEVTLPREDLFAQQFIGQAPEVSVTLTIKRGHIGDPDEEYVVYWKGRVVSGTGTSAGNEIALACESIFTSMRRPGLRARYELNCRWVLYGSEGCKVNRELFKLDGTILSITSNNTVVEVQGASAELDQYYRGGIFIASGGTQRFITDHQGDNLTLVRPIPSLVSGTAATVYPGCDHLLATCRDKFDNLDNFGGFPFIPTKNPFGGSSIV